MTMDNKTTKKIDLTNLEELEQKWKEEISKKNIANEGCVKVAVAEDGEIITAIGVSREMIPPIMEAINRIAPDVFEAIAAKIALQKIGESFTGFLNDLAKAADDDSEETGEDDEETGEDDESDSEENKESETPEAE